jgi:hypothetical protein
MSKKHPECPLYNPLNCKEYYNPKLCAFVRKDKVCLKKKKPKPKKPSAKEADAKATDAKTPDTQKAEAKTPVKETKK